MKLIITSSKNLAGMNIANYLIKKYGFEKTGKKYSGRPVHKRDDILLAISNKHILDINDLDEYFDASVYVFASTHSSQSGEPTLTAHCTGNFGEDDSYGGNQRELCYSPAKLLKTAIKELARINEKKSLGYDVCLEVTHHGPTDLKKPLLFVEVGSGEKQWNHAPAFQAVGDAIMKVCKSKLEEASCIGVGGGHYSKKFTKHVLKNDLCIGHICPKYNQHNLNENMINQMIEKTIPKPRIALVDKKGTKQTAVLADTLKSAGLEVRFI